MFVTFNSSVILKFEENKKQKKKFIKINQVIEIVIYPGSWYELNKIQYHKMVIPVSNICVKISFKLKQMTNGIEISK